MNRLIRLFEKYNLPRKFILLADLIIIVISFPIAYLLRYNLDLSGISFAQVLLLSFFPVLFSFLLAFILCGSYRGVIRYSTMGDSIRLFKATGLAVIIELIFIAFIRETLLGGLINFSVSIVVIHAVISVVFLMSFRMTVRGVYHACLIFKKDLKPVMIFGAGDMGQIAANVFENDRNTDIYVIGFIDDNKSLIGKRLAGKMIYSEDEAFEKMIIQPRDCELILAITPENIKQSRKKALFDRCTEYKIRMREVPSVSNWINGRFNTRQIRDLKIEDLLGRDPITLKQEKIAKGLKGAVVLVTGAAGSIGSEMSRQLITFDLKQLVLLDQAESPLYDLQNELLKKMPGKKFSVEIADVTDQFRMRQVFMKYLPEYVFNAAAYKHVPLMESVPYEAIRVNVGGTRILADLSVCFGVKKFVMISTDKAVNPTNIMGASKRICEIYIQSLAQSSNMATQFITTRFGNVLGSNGSVVPLFRRQIEAGGPVTVTHPDIIRYFMTIPEACQLVLEAGFMGKGGEIYVFDMGEPVKIYDLAVKMISLAGLKPGIDILIQITGLRPGEKLFEELLANEENTIPTHHPKIKAAKVRCYNFGLVELAVDELIKSTRTESESELVLRMKALVPEFISKNSKYCKYDEVLV